MSLDAFDTLNPDRLAMTGRVRETLQDLFEIERYEWDAKNTLTLYGHVNGPADRVYISIRTRMESLGFTPFLRRGENNDQLVAVPGVIKQHRPALRLPIILFLLTVGSVLLTGALSEQNQCVQTVEQMWGILLGLITSPAALASGLPFAASLLGILFTHEMGHFVVGKLRHAPVSLPYFIPMPPFISITGTMGAVIVQREPMQDRKSILEIGIAGPLAGLVVAIPLLIYGLSISQVGGPPMPPPGCDPGYLQEGNSLLYAALKWLVFGQVLPSNGVDVQLSPIAWGAWIGLLVTMLNLLPIGQLDGGHVAYALLGHQANYLAYALIGVCIALGLFIPDNYIWLIWGGMAFLIGPRHPAPLNDISRLDRKHIALAVFGLLLFVFLLMPVPLKAVGG